MTDDLLHDLLTAERGSRELSDRFLLAMGWEFETPQRLRHLRWKAPDGAYVITDKRPSPTEDMQDTIEAVPAGWWYRIAHVPFFAVPIDGEPQPCAQAEIGDDFRLVAKHRYEAATPQLALCAAILKAKGAQDGSI